VRTFARPDDARQPFAGIGLAIRTREVLLPHLLPWPHRPAGQDHLDQPVDRAWRPIKNGETRGDVGAGRDLSAVQSQRRPYDQRLALRDPARRCVERPPEEVRPPRRRGP